MTGTDESALIFVRHTYMHLVREVKSSVLTFSRRYSLPPYSCVICSLGGLSAVTMKVIPDSLRNAFRKLVTGRGETSNLSGLAMLTGRFPFHRDIEKGRSRGISSILLNFGYQFYLPYLTYPRLSSLISRLF